MMGKANGLASSRSGPEKINARKVLKISKSLSYQNCEEVEATFKDYLDQQKNEIIIDFSKISFLDSAGLELLLDMHNELKQRGGALKLSHLSDLCIDILKATQLINVFRIYEDMNKAIKDTV
jgi:stage II sporulation protein AA (anti-sigma F factor antagonist)